MVLTLDLWSGPLIWLECVLIKQGALLYRLGDKQYPQHSPRMQCLSSILVWALQRNRTNLICTHMCMYIYTYVYEHIYIYIYVCMGFPGGSDGKKSAWSAGNPSLIPGSGRSPGEGNGKPLQYSCLENSMDRGAWWATVHGSQRIRQDWNPVGPNPLVRKISTGEGNDSHTLTHSHTHIEREESICFKELTHQLWGWTSLKSVGQDFCCSLEESTFLSGKTWSLLKVFNWLSEAPHLWRVICFTQSL